MIKKMRLFKVDPWKISTDELDKNNKRLQESITSIGNGYMGMRGNFEESYSGDHHQGTYIAGVWYPDKTRVGWWKNGYPSYFGKVINAMNFIAMDIYVNGKQIDLAKQECKEFHMELNMKNGVLKRSFVVELDGIVVRIVFERFLSIAKKEMACIRMKAELLAGSCELKIASKLDSNVCNEDSNYDERFWEECGYGTTADYSYLTVKTVPNNFGIERFTVTAGMRNRVEKAEKETKHQLLLAEEDFHCSLKQGESITLDKQVILINSRNVPEQEQVARLDLLFDRYTDTYEAYRLEQIEAWGRRWEMADVAIEGDDAAQQGIRFNLFQLFSTYYEEDENLNIGPKGFTGEKYGGATYWDTEAYAVPLYIALAKPQVTKNLLKYRYNQLLQAKHNAKQQGLVGALYPMVTFTGVECHNEWEITFEEIHRNGAIPYAIYYYTNYTGDSGYLKEYGLAVLAEVSRFWADRVHFSKRAGKYMIHGVTGPNEYENNVNNNWYTNTIAAWVLRYTLECYEKFKDETEVRISAEEQNKWRDIITHMYYPTDDELGIFVQHDTFLDKDLMPVTELDPKHLPLNQKWSWDRILRSCFIKQADVLQGIYFFGDRFTHEEKLRNFEFYEPMTVHESSLSPCVHAVLAADLGMNDKALELYQRTARLDLDNYNNDTEDGLHITSMTGSWLAIVQGFAQMKTANGKLKFAPFLPKGWTGYSFRINYRDRLLGISVDQDKALIRLLSGAPLKVSLYETESLLEEQISVTRKEEQDV